MRPKVTACIITYNEEDNIRDCLESLKWVDEIVVVDSFSRDRTVEIAGKYTDRILQREWPGHIAQKNFAINQASHDWVLSLDADERLTPELSEAIRRALENDSDRVDGFYLARKLNYLGKWIRFGGWSPEYKIRLFRRGKGRWGGVDPHDKVILDGKAKKLKGDLLHFTYRDLSHQIRVMDHYTGVAARELKKKGKRFRRVDIVFRTFLRFFVTYILKLGFLDGIEGFIMSFNSAYAAFMKYARLWEIERKKRSGKGRS